MQRYFSPSTGGFYSEALHGARLIPAAQNKAEIKAGKRPVLVANPACSLPADAVPISAERHAELMAAQAQGKTLDQRGGKPVARDNVPSAEELETMRRRERDRRLAASDWTDLPNATPREGKPAWEAYRQALKDLDMAGTDWPYAPGEAPLGDEY